MRASWGSRVWPWLFLAHAALVALLLTALWLLFARAGGPPIPEAALVWFALLGLGVPWSIPVIVIDPADLDTLPFAVHALVTFGPAVLNVLLHGAALALAGRARRRHAESGIGGAQR